MVADAIRMILTHIPLVALISALLLAFFGRSRPVSERYLRWLLLLSVGVDGIWAGLFHVFAPETAAAFIGWQVSPFQFEIGVADFALGVVGIVAFWRTLEFMSAVVIFSAIFYSALAYGHVHQILTTGNLAAGNAGILLAITFLRPLLLVGLLVASERQAKRQTATT